MIRFLITVLFLYVFLGCNTSHPKDVAAVVPNKEDSIRIFFADVIKVQDTIPIKEGRKLRYLFFANGGLVGYFDDGSVVGCPRCDLLDVNIESLYEEKPFSTYTVNPDGTLFIDRAEVEYPREAGEDEMPEWAMIDYKWIIISEKYKEE